MPSARIESHEVHERGVSIESLSSQGSSMQAEAGSSTSGSRLAVESSHRKEQEETASTANEGGVPISERDASFKILSSRAMPIPQATLERFRVTAFEALSSESDTCASHPSDSDEKGESLDVYTPEVASPPQQRSSVIESGQSNSSLSTANSSTAAHWHPSPSYSNPIHDNKSSVNVQAEWAPFTNITFTPSSPPAHHPDLDEARMQPSEYERAFEAYARRFLPNHSVEGLDILRTLSLQEPQQRMCKPTLGDNHGPLASIPRQCTPFKCLRTSRDRWHEVVLPFHVTRTDEAGHSQQLVVFDVDNFFIYAFALSDGVSALRETAAPDYHDGHDRSCATCEPCEIDQDIPPDDHEFAAGGVNSLDDHQDLQSSQGGVNISDCAEPMLYQVCCPKCHGRGWLKGKEATRKINGVAGHRR